MEIELHAQLMIHHEIPYCVCILSLEPYQTWNLNGEWMNELIIITIIKFEVIMNKIIHLKNDFKKMIYFPRWTHFQ